MVYTKVFTFKTGKSPSPMLFFNMKNPTPTQKLMLTRCRIFHTQLNTGHSTGVNEFNVRPKGEVKLANMRFIYPENKDAYNSYPNPNNIVNKGLKEEEKKMKIMMRGIRLGVKKGGQRVDIAKVVQKLR